MERFAWQLLERHFGADRVNAVSSSRRRFAAHLRPDLQTAILAEMALFAVEPIGIHQPYSFAALTLPTLLVRSEGVAASAGPLQYEDIDVGEPEPFACLHSGLWLFQLNEIPTAVIFLQFQRPSQPNLTQIEIAYLPGPEAVAWTQQFLQTIEDAGRTSRVYRGKSLSFGADAAYTGMRAEMEVHKLDPVERAAVILAPATMAKIDQHVFEFDRQRAALKALGQSTRKGLLLYGPPGTGKTHVIRYVTSNLPEHTTVLITAEDIRNLSAYMTLARTLQPSIVVIEDVDLIGRSRESLHSPGAEALLNRLLNEMDGLRPDADILFILTTNGPEEIEEALAARPGRVDAAIEIPRPDADCRARLLAVYGRALTFEGSAASQAVGRSDGASAAFMKEVVRRLAQRSLMMERGGSVTSDDVVAVLDDALADADGIGSRLIGLAPAQPG